VIDPQPSPAEESADQSATPTKPAIAAATPATATTPLVLLAADDALVCVDELCLPVEATR
jgi:hypothetical protein